MSLVTIREASILTSKSRQTINDATNDGTLAFSKNKRGYKVIDVAELSRVYDLVGSLEDLKDKKDNLKKSSKKSNSSSLEEEIKSIKKDILESQERERRLLNEQIEFLKTTVEEIRKDKDTYVKLLEDHTGQDKSVDVELEYLKKDNQKLASQVEKLVQIEEQRKKARIDARNKARKEQEEKEKSRGLFSKLFG